MSIRLLAIDLYRLQGEVEKLEKALAAATAEDRGRLTERLRQARAERNHLRGVLDGQKDAPPSRGPGRP
jgi:hypothetical protein